MSETITKLDDSKLRAIIETERKIGYEPACNSLSSITPANRGLVQSWLQFKGLSLASITRARDESIRRAYNSHSYFNAWKAKDDERKETGARSNGGTLNLNDLEIGSTNNSHNNPNQPQVSNSNLQSESISTSQIRQIANDAAERTIEGSIGSAVAKEFAKRDIELGTKVKEQIISLAKDIATRVANDLIEANKKPQTVEINNNITGTTTNIGLQHEKFATLLKAASAKLPNGFSPNIWLTGPAGSGKTTAAENIAKALNLPYAGDGSLDHDHKIIGFRDAAGTVHKTEFLRVFEFGGVYCADEIDNWYPSAMLALNSALANGYISTCDGMIRRHKDCIVIACANTWGLGANSDYVGRTKLDAASLDRFFPKIEWPIDEKLERALATNDEWVSLVQNTRKRVKAQGLKILITPRATFAGCALLTSGFDLKEVIDMTLAAGLDQSQKQAIGLNNCA